MNRKKISILICMLLIITIIPSTIASQQKSILNQKINNNEPDNLMLESRNITVTVYKEGGVSPANNALIYINLYRGPGSKFIPVGYTNESGCYPISPNYSGIRVFIGEEFKLRAYHQWNGSCTIYHQVTQDDPEPLHFDMFLDINKSKSREIKKDLLNNPLWRIYQKILDRYVDLLPIFRWLK